jgi:hypothetical protein
MYTCGRQNFYLPLSVLKRVRSDSPSIHAGLDPTRHMRAGEIDKTDLLSEKLTGFASQTLN